MEYTIHTDKLVKKYKNRTVVNEVSINFTQGEIVGLLGPNGAGKTTSFYMIVGLIKPYSGRIFLNDQDISNEPMYKRAQMGIAYLPQEPSVFRQLTVEDNIKAILEFSGKNKAEQKEMLEIARCLASDPKFILLDEPFAGVDPIAVEDIQNIVRKLKEWNIGIVITDHNVHETLSITDRAYLLFEGRVLKAGTAEELAADPVVKKVYLGSNFELRK